MPLLTNYLPGRHVRLVVSIAVQQPMIYGFMNPCLSQHCWVFLNNTRLSANAVVNHLVTIARSRNVIQIACRLVCAAHPCARHRSAVADMLSAPSLADVTICAVLQFAADMSEALPSHLGFVQHIRMACFRCNMKVHLPQMRALVKLQ